MADDLPLKPWMCAGIFGPTLHHGVFMAQTEQQALVMFISSAHVQRGEQQPCTVWSCTQISDEFIAAAHRGSVAPAPVLSMVPKSGLAAPGPLNPGGTIMDHAFDPSVSGDACAVCSNTREHHRYGPDGPPKPPENEQLTGKVVGHRFETGFFSLAGRCSVCGRPEADHEFVGEEPPAA